jgi:hypothetical protein
MNLPSDFECDFIEYLENWTLVPLGIGIVCLGGCTKRPTNTQLQV